MASQNINELRSRLRTETTDALRARLGSGSATPLERTVISEIFEDRNESIAATRGGMDSMTVEQLRARRNAPDVSDAEAYAIQERLSGAASGGDSFPMLGILGVIALAVGAFYLFVAPGPDSGETVTLHRLAIGAALLIVGAVWTGGAWGRPR